LGERLALRWLGRDGGVRDFSYAQLAAETSRFAALLTRLGVNRSDAVFALLGRVPELYIVALGTLKAGAVFSPLFSAFGPTPVQQRMTIGRARALVTTQRFYERKVQPWRHQLTDLKLVLLTECDAVLPPDCTSLEALLDETPADFVTVPTRPDDLALLHFTSGTTGQPKGAMHVHEAVVAHHVRYALDLIQTCSGALQTRVGLRAPRTASFPRSPSAARSLSTRPNSMPNAGTGFCRTRR
jgi:acetyl-CoA synthetase